MKSHMNHNFANVPSVDIPRSVFDRSHTHKTAFDAGYLIPFYVDEALPGDTFHLSSNMFARLATPIYPIMDNLHLDTFFFAVPNRLVWDNWQKFCGERVDPDDSIDYLVPQCVGDGDNGFNLIDVYGYMGIPTNIAGLSVSALFGRAYNLIYNEWFRDQNLQDSIPVPRGDGPDSCSLYPVRKRGKRHDYFTSCLPWPQKGDSVDLPIGATAPVYGTDKALGLYDGQDKYGLVYQGPISTVPGSIGINWGAYQNTVGQISSDPGVGASPRQVLNVVPKGTPGAPNHSNLYADLSEASAVTINSLRQAFQIQKMLERDARGGTRYVELILSHFGVRSPDMRVQRPEYLGGGSFRMNINPVQQTSKTETGSPLGQLAAFGVGSGRNGFSKSFTEHCIIIGLVTLRADITYQQGINRMFSRQTRLDYYWPALAHLGEQEVLRKEIYAQGTEEDELVFGYQERWAEYRYYPSKITGVFKSTVPASLDAWHLAEKFETAPVLGDTFIQDCSDTVVERAIAVKTQPHVIFDSFNELRCARPMPVYSVPGLIDHF